MKHFIYILLFLFIYACNTPINNEIKEGNNIENRIDKAPPLGNYQGIMPSSPVNTMLSDISILLIDDDYRSIYQKIDPFQMGLQTEDIEMDSCQNVRELLHIEIADFKSDCDALKKIKNIKFTGFKELEEKSYDIIGIIEFDDYSKQEISFQINVLDENNYVITGPLG